MWSEWGIPALQREGDRGICPAQCRAWKREARLAGGWVARTTQGAPATGLGHPPRSPPPYRVPLPHQACPLLVTPAPSAHSLFSPLLDSRPSLAASWELIAGWT